MSRKILTMDRLAFGLAYRSDRQTGLNGKQVLDEAALEAEVLLATHDWGSGLSCGERWEAGEANLAKIVDRLEKLEPERAAALWAAYAPPEFQYPWPSTIPATPD